MQLIKLHYSFRVIFAEDIGSNGSVGVLSNWNCISYEKKDMVRNSDGVSIPLLITSYKIEQNPTILASLRFNISICMNFSCYLLKKKLKHYV